MSDKPIEDLESVCDQLMDRISDSNVSPSEAEELANKFLSATYRINKRLRDVKNDLIPLEVSKTLSYSKAFNSIDVKMNVSKVKALAESDKEYLAGNAKMSKKENERDYWKGVYDVFTNAHIFYKHLTRE